MEGLPDFKSDSPFCNKIKSLQRMYIVKYKRPVICFFFTKVLK